MAYEGRRVYDLPILAEHVGPNAEIVVMEDADHSFTGREQELGERIAWFLD